MHYCWLYLLCNTSRLVCDTRKERVCAYFFRLHYEQGSRAHISDFSIAVPYSSVPKIIALTDAWVVMKQPQRPALLWQC